MDMRRCIIRHVIFDSCEGRVEDRNKKVVADFLGAPEHEQEFSRRCLASRTADDCEVSAFLMGIAPRGQVIKLYKGYGGFGIHGGEECILAQVTLS
ncbi:MAG: hypothetical protein WC687_04855 [Patescibacteria group bacterium]